jgi:hypothetical protein
MIACNQLRIGNYVLVNESLQQVSSIGNDMNGDGIRKVGYQLNGKTIEEGCDSANIKATPITDDMLKGLGFIYHDYFQFWQLIKSDSGMHSEMNIDQDYNVLDFMRRPLVKKITSLHQLQNLYFALKGEELSFKVKDAARKSAPVTL